MPTAQALKLPLALLGGPQTFQVFPDSSDGKGHAQILHGTLEEHRAKLEQLNKAGMGVFYTVNQTDGRGRKAENITAVRAYICDIDNTPDPQEKLHRLMGIARSKAPPSAIVESRNGLHCYWYAHEGQSTDPREYAKVNEHLIKKFDGCTQSKDLARVLRVPGFMHVKEIDQPFLVRRIIEEPSRRYTADDLKRAFPLPAEPTPRVTFEYRKHGDQARGDNDHLNDDPEWVWEQVVQGLAAWTPVEGEKHRVLLLAFGVARKFEIPQSKAEDDLYPIVAAWPIKESAEQSIMKHANWAYSDAADVAHVAGLRKVGVTVDLKRAPYNRSRKKRT